MLLKLSLDINSEKGKRFQVDSANIDIEDKLGIVYDATCCSCQEPANVTLKCCTCDELYHPRCIKRPIANEVAEVLNTHPNCFWTCLHCMMNIPIVNNPPSIQPPAPIPNLDSFKSELLSEIRQLMGGNHSHAAKRKRSSTSEDPDNTMSKQRKTGESLPSTVGEVSHAVIPDNAPTVQWPPAPIFPIPFAPVPDNSVLRPHDFPGLNSDPNVDALVESARSNSGLGTVPSITSVQTLQPPVNVIPPAARHQHSEDFILHYRPVTEELAFKSHAQWHETRKLLGKNFAGIRLSFTRFNDKNGRVKFGFPTEEDMNKAKIAISSSPESFWPYENYVPALLLPKLTLYNVPMDFDLPPGTTDLSGANLRDSIKEQLVNTIISKNDSVKSMIDNHGATLEVIYVQKHRHSCTAAVKVSPNLREHIFNKCQGKLYIFSTRCNVEDRFYYQQCYHCQALGHTANRCPSKSEAPVCMYCSGRHRSSACTDKSNFSRHCCSNCLKSSDPVIKLNARSHNASSRMCPLALSFMSDIRSRTQLTECPKNR